MAIHKIDVERLLELRNELPVLDVRSPGEYKHAHIPGAVSLPLFTDEERKVIGTCYKQESREKAIKIGLNYFGPNMVAMVEQAEAISSQYGDTKNLLVHCWRGGMRSSAVAWLLNLYGFEIYLLEGGYKRFRNWVIQQYEKPYRLNVLGGYTGSGKTYVLQQMDRAGKAVLDLESLACHKGSAFGAINMPAQPSQEMFENLLSVELQKLEQHAGEDGIWVEDESQRIGSVNIPMSFWTQLRISPIYFLDIPFEERLKHIVSGYGSGQKEQLVNAIIRIQKRLGGLETKTAIGFLLEDNFIESFRVLLSYYDKQYNKGLHNRENLESLVDKIAFSTVDPVAIAQHLMQLQTRSTSMELQHGSSS
ncbi:tRNA 2-selenouridine(34) synthase MnmH [Aridibaculum aurantiacum]|uniref:tRNA 2-selenouridine(34) synthase MnmH n=1 Tax=Aridibaculum aurantiacum TaxID=2810307 RepID=UPI001A9720DE|nr:tRNA 2-selenouridine(34) synthase MnmH [Aridibaculum aurantiacum]